MTEVFVEQPLASPVLSSSGTVQQCFTTVGHVEHNLIEITKNTCARAIATDIKLT